MKIVEVHALVAVVHQLRFGFRPEQFTPEWEMVISRAKEGATCLDGCVIWAAASAKCPIPRIYSQSENPESTENFKFGWLRRLEMNRSKIEETVKKDKCEFLKLLSSYFNCQQSPSARGSRSVVRSSMVGHAQMMGTCDCPRHESCPPPSISHSRI